MKTRGRVCHASMTSWIFAVCFVFPSYLTSDPHPLTTTFLFSSPKINSFSTHELLQDFSFWCISLVNTGYVCCHKWYLLLFGFVFIVFQSHAGACTRVCPDSWRPQIRLRCSSVATCLVFETRSPIGLELTREAMLTVERAQGPACLHFPPPWLSLLWVFWGSTRGLDYHSKLLFFFHLSFFENE